MRKVNQGNMKECERIVGVELPRERSGKLFRGGTSQMTPT